MTEYRSKLTKKCQTRAFVRYSKKYEPFRVLDDSCVELVGANLVGVDECLD